MGVVEFLPNLEKNHTFFLWTLEHGLGGTAGDTVIFDQEGPLRFWELSCGA